MRVTTNQLYSQSLNRILDLQTRSRDSTNQISGDWIVTWLGDAFTAGDLIGRIP